MAKRRIEQATTPTPGAEPVVPTMAGALLVREIRAADADALERAADQLDLSDEAAELVAFLRAGGELRRWPYARHGRTYAEHVEAGGLPPRSVRREAVE